MAVQCASADIRDRHKVMAAKSSSIMAGQWRQQMCVIAMFVCINWMLTMMVCLWSVPLINNQQQITQINERFAWMETVDRQSLASKIITGQQLLFYAYCQSATYDSDPQSRRRWRMRSREGSRPGRLGRCWGGLWKHWKCEVCSWLSYFQELRSTCRRAILRSCTM